MKPLAMLAIALTVTGSTSTLMEVPEGMYIVVVPNTCNDVAGSVVNCGTPTVTVPALSTGPFTLKAVSGDCYGGIALNPNGTLVKPATWVKCP